MVADEQEPLVEVPTTTNDEVILTHDLDTVLNRKQVDIIVVGKARTAAPARSFDIRVRLGGLERQLRVFGPRRCYRAAGQLRFSEPEPVNEIDVDWTSAYGGVDFVALKKNGDPIEAFCKDQKQPYDPHFGLYAYPRNRAGKGFLIEAADEALEACALPNLEDPKHLLSPERLAVGRYDRWPGAPMVAGLGWLSYSWFPRCAMLAMPPPYDPTACPPASFPEVTAGLLNPKSIAPIAPLHERFDINAAQQSAIGMRVNELAPGAPVELVNLHREKASWAFALPSEAPQMLLQVPGQAAAPLAPKIRTVFIQPELNRVSLVWVGEHREASPVGPGKQAHIKHAIRWP